MSRDRLMLGLSTFFLGLGFVVIVLISPVWGIAGTLSSGKTSKALPPTAYYVPTESIRSGYAFVIGLTMVILCVLLWGMLRLLRSRYQANYAKFQRWVYFIWVICTLALFLYAPATQSNAQGWNVNVDALKNIPKIIEFPLFVLMFSMAIGLIVFGWFAIACTAFGARIVQLLEPQSMTFNIPTTLWLMTDFLIGQAFISILFLFLAIAGQLSLTWVAISIAAMFVVGIAPLTKHASNLAQDKQDTQKFWRGLSISEKRILVLVVMIAGLTLLNGWVRLSWDSATYYFASARYTAVSQEFKYINISYVQLTGFHTEMTFAGLMTLAQRSARVYSWFMGIIFLGYWYAIGKSFNLSRFSLVLFMAMLVSTTALVDLFGDGKTDTVGMALSVAAVWWILRIDRPERRLALVMAGLMGTLAILNRAITIYPLAVLMGGVLIAKTEPNLRLFFRRENLRKLGGALIIILVPALLIGALHILRNIMLFDDPFVPLIYLRQAPQQADASNTLGGWNTFGSLFFYRSILPIFLTFVSTPETLGVLSPLMILGLPLVFIHRQSIKLSLENKTVFRWAIGALILWIIVVPIIFEIRYVILLWVFVYLLVAITIQDAFLNAKGFAHKTLIYIVSAILVIMAVRTLYAVIFSPDFSAISQSSQCGGSVICDMVQSINQEVEPSERLLMLAPYHFYLRDDLVACEPLDEEYAQLRIAQTGDRDEFWKKVHEFGFEYIAIERLDEDDNLKQSYAYQSRIHLYPEFTNEPEWMNLNLIYSNKLYGLYRIETTESAPPSNWTCRQIDDRHWAIEEIE